MIVGGRYELLRRLATGGMAEVHLARTEAPGGFTKQVCIKLLHGRFLEEPQVVAMFREEGRIGALLSHPNVVDVFELGEHEGSPYIAMEYIPGYELAALCRRGIELGRFLPLEHAVDLVRQAALGLGYVHSVCEESGEPAGIVHRDISPPNLLVTPEGGLKIIDFGIASTRRTRDAGVSGVPGKANYMAPEQVRGEPVDHRADLFSLGIVLYELTVRRRLFRGRPEVVMGRVARAEVERPTAIRPDFSPELERTILRALSLRPEDRHASANELAEELDEHLRRTGLRSGPLRIARYLHELSELESGANHGREAGGAWVDDDRDDGVSVARPLPLPSSDVEGGTFPSPLVGQSPTSLPPPRATRAELSRPWVFWLALSILFALAALGLVLFRR